MSRVGSDVGNLGLGLLLPAWLPLARFFNSLRLGLIFNLPSNSNSVPSSVIVRCISSGSPLRTGLLISFVSFFRSCTFFAARAGIAVCSCYSSAVFYFLRMSAFICCRFLNSSNLSYWAYLAVSPKLSPKPNSIFTASCFSCSTGSSVTFEMVEIWLGKSYRGDYLGDFFGEEPHLGRYLRFL